MTPPTRAERDLEWFLTVGECAMGLHGSGFESNGASVWDSERIHLAHCVMRDPRHRDDVDRYRRIAPRFAALGATARLVCVARWSPYPWPVLFLSSMQGLRGVGVLTHAAHEAYRRRFDGREPSPAVLADWLALEATTERRHRVFRPVVAEARQMVGDALRGWDGG